MMHGNAWWGVKRERERGREKMRGKEERREEKSTCRCRLCKGG